MYSSFNRMNLIVQVGHEIHYYLQVKKYKAREILTYKQ